VNKKVLMIAAKANMIQQFNHRNIKILQDLGYEVHVATNMIDFGSMSSAENERLKKWMCEHQVVEHQVDFERRMGSFKGNIRAIRQLQKIFIDNHFDFVHVHSPLGSVLGRLVAKKFHVPSIYTAHGFHFYKGGPKLRWIFFFPLEWLFSFITDVLIVINDEDYALAKRHMHARKLIKINGIGVDVHNAWKVTREEKARLRENIRNELDIPMDAVLISSVGELSNRKNHKLVLQALKVLPDIQRQRIYYIIAGTGENGDMLNDLAKSFGFEDHFKLLGYRTDIHAINYASDIFIFPSLQEGLGVAGLEATVDGTFVIGSPQRGIADYIENNHNGIILSDMHYKTMSKAIETCITNISNTSNVKKSDFLLSFDKNHVDKVMKNIYSQE